MIVGALLGFISCVLTLTDIFPDMRRIDYGWPHNLAISIAVLGCYFYLNNRSMLSAPQTVPSPMS
ncbi:MAG: hypothetical protein HWD58_17230 [Bacteroidota bacterium]|nr:MAG: hypothetical protein HWD58_17230 [Bacteroidota bacterium]